MSAAAYNRGSRLVAQEADDRMPLARSRAERQAHKDEAERLRLQVTKLERELARARRCIAAMRLSHEARRSEWRASDSRSDAAISILCRVAFPKDGAAT